MSWHRGPMCAFDLETTGVDVETDRVVTASIVHIQPGFSPEVVTHVINPGIPVPEAAAAVHGYTTDRVQAEGGDPVELLELVVDELAVTLAQGTPVVGMNLVFDTTILDRDCRRNGVTPLSDRCHIAPVVDVRVLDKQVDRYRKGGRKLTDLCHTYDVRIDGAHDSAHDALAAARVAWRIAQKHPEIGAMTLPELHTAQIGWASEQATSFTAYLDRSGKPSHGVYPDWPIRLAPAPVEQTSLTG